jgi:pimeloyl-ACP methyl ester carboxylesterase
MTQRLHVVRSEGEPVLLLHSSGMSGRQWKKMAAELARRGLGAVVPDLTGHGQSPPWPEPEPFSFHVDVRLVVALLESTGPAHVVGHSYGGLVALHAAVAAPAAVRSLAVFDPVVFSVLDATRDATALEGPRAVATGGTSLEHEAWLRAFVDYWSGTGAWDALREEVRAEFRRSAWVVREAVRTLIEDTTSASAFAGLAIPVALVTGERSPAGARAIIARLAAAIAGARSAVIPGAGHLGPVTHPDIVNRALLGALTRTTHSTDGPA